MKGFLQGFGADGPGAAGSEPLAQPTGLDIKAPKAHAQLPERGEEPSGDGRRCHREHQKGSVSEVAVAEGLLEPFSPVGKLGFDGGKADALFEGQSGKLGGGSTGGPSQPEQVGSSEAFQGKFPAGNGDPQCFGDIAAFELAQEIQLGAFPGRRPGKVSAGVMAPELDKAGALIGFGRPRFHSFYVRKCNPMGVGFKTFEGGCGARGAKAWGRERHRLRGEGDGAKWKAAI